MKYVESFMDKLPELALSVLGRLLLAAVIFVVGFKLANFFMKCWSKSKAFAQIEPVAASFIKSCINVVLKVLVVITVIAILGIPTTSIVAVISSCGLAIGLALQGGLSNFAGGVIILITRPFKKGDMITVGTDTGKVMSIDLFYTNLVTVDNRAVIIPNGIITNSSIINVSRFSERRVDLYFTAAYENDIEAVKQIIVDTANLNSYVKKKGKEPFVAVHAYEDSAVKFVLQVWCDTDDYWKTSYSLQEEMKHAFDKNAVTIPYPQLEITDKTHKE
ncbi:MAG: mechanosensitive ion channel family protein [Clostridia bacterium]|nr:mechanosensitive ion channel family protein [Clostridia bacterium]